METKHTKGKWVAQPLNSISNGWIDIKIGKNTVTVYGDPIDPEYPNAEIIETLQANAKLIAAAPDLLEACVKMIEHYDRYLLSQNDYYIEMKAAITKATY